MQNNMGGVNARAGEQHTQMTVDDLERLPGNGYRYELVDGGLERAQSPTSVHSLVESRLHIQLGVTAPAEYLVLQGAGVSFNADRTHHRSPDLLVIRTEDFVRPHLVKPPLLVVDVVSSTGAPRDFHTEAGEYAAFGIQAYWIVNPAMHETVIDELRLQDGGYRHERQAIGEDTFATDFPFPVKIVPHWLLAGGPWRERIGGEGA
ncbi:Uma2 family endonuclease [Saccharopolyspora shandongensis]|uniref:Uma2 family endonuclease n=1 Tax=Saccharopolyspora shandongensis TaxID=418495 RepID=UPI0033D3203F